jgi:hypothetical protein
MRVLTLLGIQQIFTKYSVISQPTIPPSVTTTNSLSTLADANEKWSWRIYADSVHVLIEMARELHASYVSLPSGND